MKKYFFLSTLCMLLIVACSSKQSGHSGHKDNNNYAPPPAGKVIASESQPITNDPLNHFNFIVKVITTEYSNYGTYTVEADWGPDNATNQFTMPRGGEHLKPVLKKGSEPYTYIVGFYYNNKFYDYYQVKGAKNNIEMKYIKAYSFE